MSIFFLLLFGQLSCVQLFCEPMECCLPGSSVHGISQARILQWVAISYSSFSVDKTTKFATLQHLQLWCWVITEDGKTPGKGRTQPELHTNVSYLGWTPWLFASVSNRVSTEVGARNYFLKQKPLYLYRSVFRELILPKEGCLNLLACLGK